MTFLVLYMGALIAPGVVWVHVLGFEQGRVCVSIALSIFMLVAALAAARLAGLDTAGLGLVLLAVYAGTVAVAVGRYKTVVSVWRRYLRLQPVYIVPVVILISVLGYIAWAGPYLEVPADAWWHVGRINDVREALAVGDIGSLMLGELMEKNNYYWHAVTAYFIYLAGIGIEPALRYLAVANTALFCVGIYSFSLLILRRLEANVWKRHLMAGASVVFFVTHFGIDVFSYVRYYVFAPTLLNYIVYLAALVCLIGFLYGNQRSYRIIVVGGALVLIAAMVHYQEMVFIVLMGGAVLLVEAARYVKTRQHRIGRPESIGDGMTDWAGRKAVIVFAVIAVGYVLTHAMVYLSVERENPMTYGLMADIHNYLPFLRNLYVLKPTEQFYQVVTVWGVLVYVLFLFRRKLFLRSSYLMAGMAIPVLTIFNPVFTDFFLRYANPQVLWRMCYMIPLPLLGGYFLVRGAERSMVAGTVIGRLLGVALVLGLFALLLPIKTVYFVSSHSKVYTLAPVSQGNSHRLWSDLLAFLNTREHSKVITDQVTGYVLNGLTPHKYRGYKFYSKYASHIRREKYDEDFRGEGGWKRLVRHSPFEAREPWLVVVNRRDGELSETGLRSGHWPEDVMHVSKLYSDSFLQYIKEEGQMFRKVWTSDDKRIDVYQVETT